MAASAPGLPPAPLLAALCAAAPGPASGGGEVEPPRPDFQYVTELTADSYMELVEEVANNTKSGRPQPYYPLVLFHVSWCKHCRHALPELEQAAEMVEQGRRAGQLAHLTAQPKFFAIECDSGPEVKVMCAHHTGTSFPAAILFRDGRAVRYNRPRTSRVFAWWAMHASRPMISEVDKVELLHQLGQHSAVFILKAELGDQKLLEAWKQVALDFIEEYSFFVVQPSSEAGRMLPGAAPSVTARGASLQPLPLKGQMDRESLRDWVNFNRFVPVTQVSDWTISDLLGCGIPVVTFVHSGSQAMSTALADFEEAAKDLRSAAKYLFATVNMSETETKEYFWRKFPLITAAHEFGLASSIPGKHPAGETPLIFIFSGPQTYWEDITFTDPKAMTHERLDKLMANAEAKHDGSWPSAFKDKRKLVTRLATSSFLGAVVVVMVPSLGCSMCWLCIREIMRAEESQDDASIKKED